MEKSHKIIGYGEIEIAKFLGILLLPMVHIIEAFLPYANEELASMQDYIITWCSIGPIMFILCMGFRLGNSRNWKSLFRDGIQFLCFGVILNIIRWVIPMLIEGMIIGFNFPQIIMLCVKSDIYYFVGLFFIAYSLLKKIKFNSLMLLGVGILLFIANLILSPYISIENDLLKALVGNFIYVDAKSCFPLLSYFVFPILGIALNDLIKRYKRQDIIVPIMMVVSIIIFVVVEYVSTRDYGIILLNELVPPFNEYKLSGWGAAMSTCIALVSLGIDYYLYKLLNKLSLMKYVTALSSTIIIFYFIQWFIIGWLMSICRTMSLTSGVITPTIYWVTTITVTVICIAISIIFNEQLTRLLIKATGFTRNIFRKKH